MVKQNQIIVLFSFLLLLGSGYVFGGAGSIVRSMPSILSPAGNLEDSLVGVWEVTNVDVSAIKAQISAAATKEDKAGLSDKITTVQGNLMGAKVTIRQDHTYENQKGNIFLVGTWKLDNHDFIPHSTNLETIDRRQSIISLSATAFTVKCDYGNSIVVITYTRRQ